MSAQKVTGCLRTAFQSAYRPEPIYGIAARPVGMDPSRPPPRTLGADDRPVRCGVHPCENEATIWEALDPADGHGDGIAVCAGCAFSP